MKTKYYFMAYCVLFAFVRLGCLLFNILTHYPDITFAVTIISGCSVVFVFYGFIYWIAHRDIRSSLVRFSLFFCSVTNISNIIITRSHPVPTGTTWIDMFIIGTVFDLILFVISLMIPFPDKKY